MLGDDYASNRRLHISVAARKQCSCEKTSWSDGLSCDMKRPLNMRVRRRLRSEDAAMEIAFSKS